MNSFGKGRFWFRPNGLVGAGRIVCDGRFKRGGFGGGNEDVRGGTGGAGRICIGMVCGVLGEQKQKMPPAWAVADRHNSVAVQAMIRVDVFIKKLLSSEYK